MQLSVHRVRGRTRAFSRRCWKPASCCSHRSTGCGDAPCVERQIAPAGAICCTHLSTEYRGAPEGSRGTPESLSRERFAVYESLSAIDEGALRTLIEALRSRHLTYTHLRQAAKALMKTDSALTEEHYPSLIYFAKCAPDSFTSSLHHLVCSCVHTHKDT